MELVQQWKKQRKHPARPSCVAGCSKYRKLTVATCCLLAVAILIYLDIDLMLPPDMSKKMGLSDFKSPLYSNESQPGMQNSPEDQSPKALDRPHLVQWRHIDHAGAPGRQQDPVPDVDIQSSNNKILLVVAYMRTGSTLTAKLFEQVPGAFFSFEPLRAVHEEFSRSTGSVTLHYPNNIKRTYKNSDMHKVYVQEISSWLTCNLESLSIPTLTDEFLSIFSRSLKPYYTCVKQQSFAHLRGHYSRMNINNRLLTTCLANAKAACRRSNLLVMKYIRLPMHIVEILLSVFPGMKVIHLHRDPRGMFNSRFKLNVIRRKDLSNRVNAQCDEIHEDLKVAKSLIKKYPKRLKIVRYEDIAGHPIAMAKELFSFLDVKFTDSVQDFVRGMTQSSRDDCSYCIARKSSMLTANRWRWQIRYSVARYIDSACNRSNAILGYKTFKTEKDMKDMTLTYFTDQIGM